LEKSRVPMNDINAASLPADSRRFYPVILCFFIGSGAAALVYEIVWFQLLELVIGSSAVSIAVLLGTFMGGMCLGSIAFARIVPASWHPLRVYAVMEFGIGVIAIAVLYVLPYAGDLYSSIGGHGFTGIFFRALLCVAFLLPPTVLMGATLPCAGRWVERTPEGVSWLGILYTANLAGAVFGCLLAGFYLLRLYDMVTATLVAAAINALLGVLALALAAVAAHHAPTASASAGRMPMRFDAVAVYLTIGLSGLTALGAQVVWTRLLSLLLGTSVYTFSIILAVFLLGLGLGSSAGAYIARKSDPRVALGWSQALLIVGIAWAAVSIGAWLPFWPVNPLLSVDPWITFQLDLVRGLWAVLPAACLWGASFPLALAAAAPHHNDGGRTVGAVYAANTIGAIIGALTFSMILIPRVGTLWSQRILIAIAAIAALLMMAATLRRSAPAGARSLAVRLGGAAAVVVATVALGFALPSVPGELFAYGRKIMAQEYELQMLYLGEGLNASVAVSRREDGARSFHVSGKTEATSDPVDMRLQRMLGHWSVLLHPKPRTVLVVGFGAGVTAGSFVTYPEIERIVICEIEPLIPQKIAAYFSKENYDVLKDPRVEVIYDDARHYILTSKEKFDIITTDPIHPWVKGAATLYTKEFFDLARKHLKPGGVITQWVPLYESTPEVVKSEMATFFSVFPEGLAWINDREGGGDVVLFGQANPAPITFADIDRRLSQNERAAESMLEVGFESGMDVAASYAGRSADLKEWLKGAAINTDRDLRLQYLAGMGVNVNATDQIYKELMDARKFPEGLFIASADTLTMLREAIENKELDSGPKQ
jgi:spermidine synthase